MVNGTNFSIEELQPFFTKHSSYKLGGLRRLMDSLLPKIVATVLLTGHHARHTSPTEKCYMSLESQLHKLQADI